ncbi:MAG TPA: hypothetical protein ENO14_04865 [Chromatiales bacterium]|nr:hypothetical protein [Chromatiales bacterium]
MVFLAKRAQASSAFLVDRSYGIRQVPYGEQRPLSASGHHAELDSLPGFDREVRLNDEWLPVLDFRGLLENDQFLNAVA